jgi:hypothetical protein
VPVTPAQLRALADSFPWGEWNAKIHAAIKPAYTGIAIEQGALEAERNDIEFNPADPFCDRFFTSYLGERITQLDETTRDLVREALQSALEDGKAESLQELAGHIREVNPEAFSPARALNIARTESAYAYGHGAGLAFRQAGIEQVEISDGDGCEECAAAAGEIWDLDEYLANTIEHPNCVRSASPVVSEEE